MLIFSFQNDGAPGGAPGQRRSPTEPTNDVMPQSVAHGGPPHGVQMHGGMPPMPGGIQRMAGPPGGPIRHGSNRGTYRILKIQKFVYYMKRHL